MYRRGHPLAICFSLGIAFIGVVTLLFPESVEQSATSLALPEIVRKVFNICYVAGGVVSAVGLLRVRHRLEAAGMAILASVLFVQWASILYVTDFDGWVTAMFVLALAVGCALRSVTIARGNP